MNKRFIALVIVLLITFSVVPHGIFTVSAANMTIAEMQKKYPHGKYWNGKNPESYTSTPCTHHVGACSYDGSCGCATYKNYAIQCMGFAFQLAYTAYGGEPYLQWEVDYNSTTALNNLKPGDVIRYNFNGHSAFVYGVSGDTVTFADCNSGNNCVIRWGGTITKTKLKESFTSVAKAPYSLSENHTHSYTAGYDTAHPHKQYNKCSSCGYHYYTGSQKSVSGCSECANSIDEVVAHPMPIKAIPLSGQVTTAYQSVNGKAKSQKIGKNGICYIRELYDNGWCKIDYTDTAGGSQTGYVKSNVFFNPAYALFKITADKKIITYARGDLKEEIGYTVAGDTSYVVDHNQIAAQILYPISGGGYRAAWIPLAQLEFNIRYNANGGVGNMNGFILRYGSQFTLANNTYTKAGNSFGGWNLCRSMDSRWYCNEVGWKTEAEIKANGYTKKVYQNGFKATLSKAFVENGTTGGEFVFYPIWNSYTLTVYYNTGGGNVVSDKYRLQNGMVYSTESGLKYSQTWKYNSKKSKGLTNYTTLGLVKSGYTFKGWSPTPTGEIIYGQDDTSLLPTSINTNLSSGSCHTVLYAIWESNAPKVTALSVASAPTKTVYNQGETLNTAGLRLNVVYNNGTTATIDKGFTTGLYDNKSMGRKIVEVTFGGMSTFINITVAENATSVKPDPVFSKCTHPNLTIVSTTSATCSAFGQKSYYCGVCAGTRLESVAKLPHTVAISQSINPTCETVGKTLGLNCSVCKATIEIQTDIPAFGHAYKEKVTTKATTKKTGKLQKTCETCGKVTTSTIKKIKSLKLSSSSYTYNGKAKKPSVTVKNSSGKKLKKGTDYIVKYASGRKAVGEYKVTISFKGKYKGTSYLYFKIKPKGTSLKSVTAKSKSLTVKWNQQAKKTTGYQIQYSTSKTFKAKYTKKITVSKTKTTSKTIKKLKSNKKYYLRIRTYKTVKGKKIYSSWSKVKTKKTKK